MRMPGRSLPSRSRSRSQPCWWPGLSSGVRPGEGTPGSIVDRMGRNKGRGEAKAAATPWGPRESTFMFKSSSLQLSLQSLSSTLWGLFRSPWPATLPSPCSPLSSLTGVKSSRGQGGVLPSAPPRGRHTPRVTSVAKRHHCGPRDSSKVEQMGKGLEELWTPVCARLRHPHFTGEH